MHDGPVVVFSGGGTGGHLYPALALADALRELRPDVRAFFVGATRGLEARVLPERGEEHLLLPVRGIDRTSPLSSWRAIPELFVSVWRAVRAFRELRPEAVVVTGGYAGAPAGVAARLLGIPLVLQEQNSVPGFSTRALATSAKLIHVAFPEARGRLPGTVRARVRESGNPVRPMPEVRREEARSLFGLPADAFVVLVTGGSQGARALNQALVELILGVSRGNLPKVHGLHLLWATGRKHFGDVCDALEGLDAPWVHCLEYFEDMPAALATADLAVSRAGAMTTAELLNAALPAILVPLPTSAANHQTHNAGALAAAGAALVVPESTLTALGLWDEVTRLASAPGTLAAMREAAASRARPHAAATIARDIGGLLVTGSGER